jgi:hypothetical protein
MARKCTICEHPNRNEIDADLVSGESYRNIAARFGTSAALVRHKGDHIPAHLARAKEAETVTQADDLLIKVADIEKEAKRIAKKAEDTGDLRTAMSGIRELARLVELLAKLRGELNERPTVNILVMPEWVQIRNTVVGALEDFPEARIAVADALMKLDEVNGHRT